MGQVRAKRGPRCDPLRGRAWVARAGRQGFPSALRDLDALRLGHRPGTAGPKVIAVRRPYGWPPSHPLRQSPAPEAAGRPLRRWQLNSNELCGADFAILRRLDKTCLNASDPVHQGALGWGEPWT